MATASAKAHRRSKLREEHEEHVNHERWLITYADMITLLMVLFIVLYSISQVDLAKFRRLKQGIAGGFGGPTAPAALSRRGRAPPGGGGGFCAPVDPTRFPAKRGAPPARAPDVAAGADGRAGGRPGPPPGGRVRRRGAGGPQRPPRGPAGHRGGGARRAGGRGRRPERHRLG